MRTLSSRLPLIRRIGRKIKIWPKESAVDSMAFPSRVSSSHRNRPAGSTTGMARIHSSPDTAGVDRPNAQPEYWFSTDAYITTVDKRHLHFDGLRWVHLTFRMHFAGHAHHAPPARVCVKKAQSYLCLSPNVARLCIHPFVFISRCANPLRIPHKSSSILPWIV